MPNNANLRKAQKAKNDEFYTQYVDIEKEMNYYTGQLKGLSVYCPCDSEQSNFWKYFLDNYERLGLKHLTATHIEKGRSERLDYDGKEVKKTLLEGNGDFRDEECVKILDESDIVVTNPPFSLFREFIDLLIKHNKKFLILGNNNAVACKDIFPLFKDNKIWYGYAANKTMEFEVPMNYKGEVRGNKKYGNVPAISWYTNLPVSTRNEKLILVEKYDPNKYPKYDNYDAIEVSEVAKIPMDYKGVMGVPITFLDKYCPAQFEIIKFRKGDDDKDLSVKGKCPYLRVLIKRK